MHHVVWNLWLTFVDVRQHRSWHITESIGTTAMAQKDANQVVVGVLALQGSFAEHASSLRRSGEGVQAVEVRVAAQLEHCDGLVIPGGESTTMARLAEREGMATALREFAAAGKPVWGTCAGLIMLSDKAECTKQGGQALIGGLHVSVIRNFFGAQVESFETKLPAPACIRTQGDDDHFRAVFIRAPAIADVGEGVEVLAEYHLSEVQRQRKPDAPSKVAVAVRQGHLWATAFHPELTSDLRWHKAFADMAREVRAARVAAESESASFPLHASNGYNRMELPIYE